MAGSGWAETVAVEGAPMAAPRVLGVDCEMVKTKRGSECARVTVVDGETGATVFDELVKAEVPVVDYCTPWSGIDAAMLAGATTTLDCARACLLREIRPTDVLVGHSLDNDLQVLKLAHANVGDTALLYGHPKGAGYKRSLKHLSHEFLGLSIQSGAHDSAEDARAALALFGLKVRNGPDFGSRGAAMYVKSSLERLANAGCRVAFASEDAADRRRVARGTVSAVAPAKKDDVADCVAKQLAAGWHLVVAAARDAAPAAVDAAAKRVHAALPEDALLVVVTQPPLDDADRLARLKKTALDHRATAVWSDDQEACLQAALDAAAYGRAFVRGPKSS